MIRTLRIAATAAVLSTAALATTTPAVAGDPLSAEQRAAVQALVRETLVSNPEILIEAMDALQAKEASAKQATVAQALAHLRPDLERDPASPVMGNPDGDVTIVEFFDYRCGYCKRAFADVQAMVESDPNIRVVMKEWPILGDDSVYASRLSLAVWNHQSDKYTALHTAMMVSRGNLTNGKVDQIALESGVDLDKAKKDMGAKEIDDAFAKTSALANALGFTGTPAFVIGDNVGPGAIPRKDLQRMVDAARSAK